MAAAGVVYIGVGDVWERTIVVGGVRAMITIHNTLDEKLCLNAGFVEKLVAMTVEDKLDGVLSKNYLDESGDVVYAFDVPVRIRLEDAL